jgi:hypothetical protein
MLANRLAEAAAVTCGQKFVISGGDGERQEAPKDDDGNQEQEDQQKRPEDSDKDNLKDSGDTDSQDSGDDDSDSGDDDSQAELDRLKRENITLKRDKTRLEGQKKKAEGDREAAAERDELRTENAKLKDVLDTKFLEWAITTNDKYKWVDAEDVVKALDREAVNIDLESGDIDGLDLELKRIAKKKPHWLQQEEKEQEQPNPRSGFHPIGGNIKQDEAETKRLGEKFKIPGFGSQAVRSW